MSEHVQTVVETSGAITSVAAKTTVLSGFGSLLGKLTGLDPITAIGLIVGVGGLAVSFLSFLINWHYKRLENKRADELHALKRKNLEGKCDVER